MPSKIYISPRRFYATLQRIADHKIGPVERAFLTAARIAASDIAPGALAAALLARDVFRAFDAVGLNGQLEAKVKSHMATALQSVFAQSAIATAFPLGSALNVNVTGMFNKTNAEAVLYAQRQAAKLVTEVSETTKDRIRSLIVRGFVDERTIATTQQDIARLLAKRVKATMGLRVDQYEAVQAYRTKLRERATIQAAVKASNVETVAREMQLSPQKVRAAVNRPRVTLEQAEARVERLAAKKLRQRANMVSRTETIQASAAGQRALWRAAEAADYLRFNPDLPTQYTTPDGGLIDGPTLHPNCRCAEGVRVVDSVAVRYWIVTPDDRLCELCAQMPALNADGVGIGDVESARMAA